MQTRPSHSNENKAPIPSVRLEERIVDEARLFLSWLDNPAIAGAISPSGPNLARMMARYVDPHLPGPVIELGPGTGVITEALLQRGVASERLCLIEYDRGFCKLLRKRFPDVRVVQGDAYQLAECLRPFLNTRAAAIVSSLPLLMKPEPARLALLAQAFELLTPDGRFIQFTYGPLSPMPRASRSGPAFHAEASAPVWFNLPPARVWVYRPKSESGTAPAKSKHQSPDLLAWLRLGTEHIHLELRKEVEGARARLGLRKNLGLGGNKPIIFEPALRILRHLPDLHKRAGRDN